MSNATQTEALIAYHVQGFTTPESPEVRQQAAIEGRRRARRLEAQRRFDTIGLPRGLRVVG